MEKDLGDAAEKGDEAALTALLDAKIVDIDGVDGVSERKEERHLRLSQFDQLARLAFRLGRPVVTEEHARSTRGARAEHAHAAPPR